MRVLRGYRRRGNTPVALTIGNFDGVHLGHQAMIERLCREAASRGLAPWLLTFEPHPREFFSPLQAPARLTSLREKIDCLTPLGLAGVAVAPFNACLATLPPARFISDVLADGLGARWILVGDDFRFGAQRAGDLETLRQNGAEFGIETDAMDTVYVDGLRVSSTAVRELLATGDFHGARRLLGRPFSLLGRVEHGKKLGRVLGFPTANIVFRHRRPPVSGIFVVEIDGLGEKRQGVASLGVRPTLDEDSAPTLEVFVFDFDESIYGHWLKVTFLKKLRDEEKYPDLDQLKRQIAADVEAAKHYFAEQN